MTSFGWKRKIGMQVKKSKVFEKETEDSEKVDGTSYVDWLLTIKRRKINPLEDDNAKSERLKSEADFLAEQGRYWEAVSKWNDAINLTPHNEKLYEAKAQALMHLNELFPAIVAAEKAVKLNPTWWVAYQTLGRAQLGIGEIKMAVQNFSKAIHLNPENTELWNDDLKWSVSLLQKKKEMETTVTVQEKARLESLSLVLDDDGAIVDEPQPNQTSQSKFEALGLALDEDGAITDNCQTLDNQKEKWVKCRI